MKKINGSKILSIVKVVFEDILLELHFNIEHFSEEISFEISISNDGETVMFAKKKRWVKLNQINYEIYSATEVNRDDSELAKLLENKILSIRFGIGKTIKINTDKNDFLFFNNGDRGAYSFEKIETILENDIYGYAWFDEPPLKALN